MCFQPPTVAADADAVPVFFFPCCKKTCLCSSLLFPFLLLRSCFSCLTCLFCCCCCCLHVVLGAASLTPLIASWLSPPPRLPHVWFKFLTSGCAITETMLEDFLLALPLICSHMHQPHASNKQIPSKSRQQGDAGRWCWPLHRESSQGMMAAGCGAGAQCVAGCGHLCSAVWCHGWVPRANPDCP